MKSKYLLLLFILFPVLGFSSHDPVVIQVNNCKITYKEFRDRLNELPIPNQDSETLKVVKRKLVCSLIGEAILAMKAKKENFNKLPRVRLMADEYRKEALYEEWMKEEVTNKIRITPEEIQKGYNRLQKDREVEYWTLPNLIKANAFRNEIIKGIDPVAKPKYKLLEYGIAEENIEDTVYSMKVGQISEPIKVDSLYYIFKLTGIVKDPRYSQKSVGYYKSTIMERIKAKKDLDLMSSKLDVLMRNKGFSMEEAPFKYLLSELEPIIFNKKMPKAARANLIQQELYTNDLKSGKWDDVPLVIFKSGKIWTIRDVWERLAVSPFPLNYKTPNDLKYELPEVIKKIVLVNDIAKDAEKKGLDKSDYVQFQTNMWTNNLLAQAMLNKESKKLNITNKDLIEYYDSTKNNYMEPERRKIIPIVVKSKKLAEMIYRKIKAGAGIVPLAKKYSTNKYDLFKKDPGIYIAPGSWGEAGKAVFTIRPGQITPPKKINDSSYAVIKLLEIKSAAPYPFNQVKDELLASYQGRKIKRYVEKFLLRVIKKYKIKINWNLLNEVQYAGGNMSVRKTHFPLRNAVPYFPFFNYKAEWFKEAMRNLD